MKKVYLKMSLVLIVLLFSCSFSAFAQFPPSFGDDVDDETPAATIDTLVLLGCLIGGVYGIKKNKD